MHRHASLFVAPLLLASCGLHRYHPVVPHVASDRDATAVVQAMTISDAALAVTESGTVMLDVDLFLPAGMTIGGPSLNAATAAPCRGGIVAGSDQLTTPAARWEPARAALSFALRDADADRLFGARDAVLDLPLHDADRGRPARCLRVPLQSAGGPVPDWRSIPWLNGLELRGLYLARPLPNFQGGAFLVGLAEGTWISGWRLAVVLEGGLVGVRVPVSAPPEGTPVAGLIGNAVEADRIVFRRGGMALDLQLAYDALATIGPDAEGAPVAAAAYRAAVLHGPRGSLRLLSLIGRQDRPGFASPPDAAAAALSVFVGAWWQGTHPVPAPILGASIEGNLGL